MLIKLGIALALKFLDPFGHLGVVGARHLSKQILKIISQIENLQCFALSIDIVPFLKDAPRGIEGQEEWRKCPCCTNNWNVFLSLVVAQSVYLIECCLSLL